MEQKVKPVGIWVRVSTERQAEGDSPEHHELRAKHFAMSKDWKVKEVYHLEGVSGKSVMEDAEAKRMLEDIKRGHIKALIFSKLARLGRNTRQLLDFADSFKEAKADMVSLDESIDTSTPMGRLFYTLMAAFAQCEREEIASRVAASVGIRAKLGKPLGGSAPYGYQWVDKKLVIEPKEAPIRKRVYELFLEHRRVKRVAKVLNQAGHRTRSGAKFSDSSVKRMLADPSAKGLHRANYTKSQGEGKGWELKPKEDWVYTEIDPIVEESIWDQCNELISQKRNGKKPAKKPVHLFAGVAFCKCGNKLYVPSTTPKYVCFKCRNKIPIADLEGIFQEKLKSFVFSANDIGAYLESADKTIKDKETLIATLEKEKASVQTKMEKVFKLYEDGVISTQGFGERNRPLEERIEQIKNELPKLQGEIDFLKIKLHSSDQALNEAKDLYSRWPRLGFEERHRIVETIVESIIVGKKEIEINLNYLPSAELAANSQQTPVPVLPFCRLTLIGQKRLKNGYPCAPKTLGEHLKKRRMDLGLLQKEAATQLGTHANTLAIWEADRFNPAPQYLPRIYKFLGYTPHRPTKTLAEKLVAYREARGLSKKQLAKVLGVHRRAVQDWEREDRKPTAKSLVKIGAFLSRE